MNWFNQYKLSLKNIDAEEPLDIYFYRPIAFIVVKTFYAFPLTPNHYSLLALISGLIAGYQFLQGTEAGLQWGALAYLMFAIFDCCDGMVARLKKNGSEFGRVIDGLVDYAVNGAVYIALAIGVTKIFPQTNSMIPHSALIILAGISKAVHAITFDHYLAEFMSHAQGKSGFALNELALIKQKLKKAVANKENFFRIAAWKAYYGFTKLQAGKSEKALMYNPEEYCRSNLKLIKLWSFIGPAPHGTILILAFLAKSPDLFYAYSIVFCNLWLIIMFFFQKHMNSTLAVSKESVV